MTRELAAHVDLDSELQGGLEEVVGVELESDKPMTDQLLGVVRYLKVNKVNLPIETTLVVRNLHALQKFSELAGFDSLQNLRPFFINALSLIHTLQHTILKYFNCKQNFVSVQAKLAKSSGFINDGMGRPFK